MVQRNYLGAIDTLNKFQTVKAGHASLQPKYNKLEAMAKYMSKCKIPLEKLDTLPIIHVTGTHGKGSTCFYCERILLSHGYRTGFYSSPHLLEVRERIRIDGRPISKNVFAVNFWEVYDMLDNQKEHNDDMPLYFSFLTILAFHVFLKSEIDVAIVEVGIGGEFDCTNVIRVPVAVGITPISVDHTAQLGVNEDSIAWHKGGIMKPGSTAVSVSQPENALRVLLKRSKEKRCPLNILRKSLYPVDFPSRIPLHIRETAASLAIALSEIFINKQKYPTNASIKDAAFSLEIAIRSIENSSWPGRYDIRNVKNIRFFLDGAHTQNSIKTTAEWFTQETARSTGQKVLIFNLTGKREPVVFLEELLACEFDTALFIPNVGYEEESADVANFKLSTDVQLKLCEDYKALWMRVVNCEKHRKIARVFPSFIKALRFLEAGNNQYNVLVTGSLYLVGAVLSVLDSTLSSTLDGEL